MPYFTNTLHIHIEDLSEKVQAVVSVDDYYQVGSLPMELSKWLRCNVGAKMCDRMNGVQIEEN